MDIKIANDHRVIGCEMNIYQKHVKLLKKFDMLVDGVRRYFDEIFKGGAGIGRNYRSIQIILDEKPQVSPKLHGAVGIVCDLVG